MSRTLTYLLRHGAEKEGLAMDASGFVRVRELMRRPDLDGLDEVRLRSLVSSCPKQVRHLSAVLSLVGQHNIQRPQVYSLYLAYLPLIC